MEVAYILLPFVVSIINVFLAGLVLKSDPGSFRHRIFAVFLAAMALWGFAIFGMRSSPSLSVAYQWEKVALSIIPLVSIFFYHFSVRFTYSRASPWALRTFYGLGVLTAALSFSGQVATGMQLKWYGYAPVLGPAFPLYLVVAYLPTFMALWVLFRAYKRSSVPDERTRLSYVILAATISLVGGTTDYLPVLGVGMYPMGIVFNILFGVVTTIAVTRYRLLELRLVLRSGFVYSFISSVIFATYGVIFAILSVLFRRQTTAASVIALVGAVFLITIILPPTIGRVQRFVDRLFFRERYDHLLALQSFTSETRDIGDFVGLASSLTRTVTLAMQSDWVALLLPDAESGDYVDMGLAAGGSVPLFDVKRSSSLARWLARSEQALRIEALDVDPLLQTMGDAQRLSLQSSGAQLFVPMQSKRRLTGILILGHKIVDDGYSRADIDLLTTVASQAATIIENSRLYSQEMARLQELERLEDLKSNLLRTVSHELKSPLTAIKASVDILYTSGERLEERRLSRVMRTLRSGVSRMEQLVEESLDYAQMQSAQLDLRLEPTDMAVVVEEAVDLVEPSFRAKQQKLTVEVSPNLPQLVIDGRRIERVLVNLLSNANKFTPFGGTVSLSLRVQGGSILVEVTDNGSGIPEEDLELLFHEFYRGSNADGQQNAGTGLGLAISKYLVELHGGTIEVRSIQGVGTTFFFTLPLPSPR